MSDKQRRCLEMKVYISGDDITEPMFESMNSVEFSDKIGTCIMAELIRRFPCKLKGMKMAFVTNAVYESGNAAAALKGQMAEDWEDCNAQD